MTKVEVLLPVGFAGADADEWTRPRGFPRPDALDRAVDVLPSVGPAVKRKLQRLGLETIGDLLTHRPFRYEEPVPERRIADLQGDEDVAITGEVLSVSNRRRGRLQMLTARISDGTATISATWFNQPWLQQQLHTGTEVRLRGRQGKYGFDVRSFDIGDGGDCGLRSRLPGKRGRTARSCARSSVRRCRRHSGPLPADLKQHEALPARVDALWALHRPRSLAEAEVGRRRLR